MISVIIVLKKPTKFLEKNLFCFSKQKNKKFEVILISENDIEINQNFNFKLKTLKSKTNLPGPKRHLGAENAQGEILAFIDDDAYPDEKWIDTIYKTVKSKNSITGPAISPKYEKLSVLKNLYSSIDIQ